MNRKYCIVYVCIIWILTSCVDPIKIHLDSESGHLVVDGLITDQKGPYEIKLSVSKKYFPSANTADQSIINGAEVFIQDNSGNIITLEEKVTGKYITPNDFIGQVGSVYILNIKLADGRSYRSLPEKLMPNVGIDTIRIEYITKYKLNENNVELGFDGMDVNIDTNPLDGNEPFYRWRYTGTYEVLTYPENQTKKVGDSEIANPPPCSGWIPTMNGGKVQVGPCTCCYCWIEEINQEGIVSNASFVQSNIRNVNMRFIENQDSRFGIKYHVNIEQLSLSKEAHDFWRIIAQQQDQGSIFDQPAGTLPTNLYSLDDPVDVILGFFSASSI